MTGTFAMVPSEVLALGNGHAVAVYAAIAHHANQEGTANPSIPRLMAMTGWSKPTIIKAIATLCAAGALVREHRFHNGMQQANGYVLVLDRRVKSANVQGSTTFTTQSTTFTQGVKEIDSRGKGRLPELEVLEPEEIEPEPPKPPKGRSAERFEQFWKAYPRKVGKQAARKWWDRHTPDDALLTAILDALAWQRTQPGWTKQGGEFIPHATTWLNRGGWEDERPETPPSSSGSWQVIRSTDGGYDPLQRLTPESREEYERQLAKAMADAERWSA